MMTFDVWLNETIRVVSYRVTCIWKKMDNLNYIITIYWQLVLRENPKNRSNIIEYDYIYLKIIY